MERVSRSIAAAILLLACATTALADDVVYTYDAQGRLISVVYAGKAKVDYVYDTAGNRIERTTGSAPSNTAPTAANDSISLTVNSSVTFAPQDNDTDPLPLRVKSVGTPSNGTATILQAGAKVRYKPNTDHTGSDSFTYTIADFYGATATATVSVTINSAATAGESATGITYTASSNYGGFTGLTASNGMRDGLAGSPATTHATQIGGTQWIQADLGSAQSIARIEVLANGVPGWGEFYLNGAQVQYSTNGTSWTPFGVVRGASGETYATKLFSGQSARYIRLVNPNWLAVGDFRIYPGAGTANVAPDPANDTLTTPVGTVLYVYPLENDVDADNDILTITAVGNPSHGTTVLNTAEQIIYTPTANYSGADSFTYTVSDGRGGTDTATVNITVVLPEITATVFSASSNQGGLFEGYRLRNGMRDAQTNTYTSAHHTATSGDSSPWFKVDLGVAQGIGEVRLDAFQIAPGPTYLNGAVLEYSTNDSSWTTLTSSISGASNTAPAVIAGGGVSARYLRVRYPSHVLALGNFRIFRSATLGSNAAPIAVDDGRTTPFNTALTFDPRANDSDPNSHSMTIVSVGAPLHGTAAINSGTSITYTPTTGYAGRDDFSYITSDGNGGTALAFVTVTIPPTGTEITSTTFSGGYESGELPEGLTGIETVGGMRDGLNSVKSSVWAGAPIEEGEGPAHLTVDLGLSKYVERIDVLPAAATFGGSAAVTNGSTVHRSLNGTDWTEVGEIAGATTNGYGTLSLANAEARYIMLWTTRVGDFRIFGTPGPNNAPSASNDALYLVENTSREFDPRLNDTDPEGTPLIVSLVGAPSHGMATITNGGASITYSPTPSYDGSDSFSYTVTDGTAIATATVSVTVFAAGAEITAGTFSASSNYINSFTGLTTSGGMRNGSNTSASSTHGTNDNTPAWIRMDIGKVTPIGDVKVMAADRSGFEEDNTNGAVIQYSLDGVAWTNAATISGLTINNTVTNNLGGVLARYVRVKKDTGQLGLGDFRVYVP